MPSHQFSWKKAKAQKTCAVIRLGAIGDALIASSIYPSLKDAGFHVTLYCQSGAGYEVVKHDPHIDRFIIQEVSEMHHQTVHPSRKTIKGKRWTSIKGLILAQSLLKAGLNLSLLG